MLITGETGTGKELMARALHRLSGRPGELVAVNVAGLDDTMFSDTLFGHGRGAFTGADRPREGLIASAAEAPSSSTRSATCRCRPRSSCCDCCRTAASTRSAPTGRARAGRGSWWRPTPTSWPPWQRGASARTSTTGCAPTTSTFRRSARASETFRSSSITSSRRPRAARQARAGVPLALYQLLKAYGFPGNVRELEAMVFDAVARHQGVTLSLASFSHAISGEPRSPMTTAAADEADAAPFASLFPDRLPTLREAEDHLIAEALDRAEGNQGVAAGMLGLSRQALNKRLSRRRAGDGAAGERDSP